MVGAPVKPTTPAAPSPVPQKPKAPTREGGAGGKRNGQFGLALQIIVSIVLIWHFTGVFLAALSIPTTSKLVMLIAQRKPMQWYLDALYMNQGHSFFAPEVGPGHLIRYELLDQSGRPIEQGELPNRKTDWPRLFYHRHMMLADQAEMPTDDKQLSQSWQRKYLRAYGLHLLRTNEKAQSVHLTRLAHWPLPRDLAEKGVKMTDPKGYETVMELTVSRNELQPAAAPPAPNTQSLYWQNTRPNVANRGTGVAR